MLYLYQRFIQRLKSKLLMQWSSDSCFNLRKDEVNLLKWQTGRHRLFYLTSCSGLQRHDFSVPRNPKNIQSFDLMASLGLRGYYKMLHLLRLGWHFKFYFFIVLQKMGPFLDPWENKSIYRFAKVAAGKFKEKWEPKSCLNLELCLNLLVLYTNMSTYQGIHKLLHSLKFFNLLSFVASLVMENQSSQETSQRWCSLTLGI